MLPMRYKGPRVGIINKQDIIRVWDIAFSIACLTMFNKICQVASLLSLLLSGSMAAFGFVAFRYMQSPEFERNLKNKLMGDLKEKIVKEIQLQMPKMTSPALPL